MITLCIGFGVGKSLSPPFADPTIGPRLLAEFLSENALALDDRRLDGDLDTQRRRNAKRETSLVCGLVTYTYLPLQQQVVVKPATERDRRYDITNELRPPAPSTEAVFAALFGSASTYTITSGFKEIRMNVFTAGSTGGNKEVLMLLLGALSGFSVGVYLGYESVPKCGDDKISVMLKDKQVWRAAQSFDSYAFHSRSDL